MLSDNIKGLRKSKGLSQAELAAKLSVVRQTISKWEQGISVPDSEMLIKIAEALNTSVSTLLGESISSDNESNSEIRVLAEKLEVLNLMISAKNERNRKAWRIIFIASAAVAALYILYSIITSIFYHHLINSAQASVGIIGGADGPTSIFVTSLPITSALPVVAIIILLAAVAGLCLTRKK